MSFDSLSVELLPGINFRQIAERDILMRPQPCRPLQIGKGGLRRPGPQGVDAQKQIDEIVIRVERVRAVQKWKSVGELPCPVQGERLLHQRLQVLRLRIESRPENRSQEETRQPDLYACSGSGHVAGS